MSRFEAPGEVNEVFLVIHRDYEDTYVDSVWRDANDAFRRRNDLDAENKVRLKRGSWMGTQGTFSVERFDLG